MNALSNTVKKVYVFLFARKALYRMNLLFYKLSMTGIGIHNYENDHVSGERAFIRYMKARNLFKDGVILDVGANVGHYAIMLRENNILLPIFAFEPNPVAFKKLEQAASAHHFIPVERGAGAVSATAVIYDYAGNTGSEHASMYKEVISDLRNSEAEAVNIDLVSIDQFVAENKIAKIALLKIDTEGHELNVLKGAKDTIERGLVNVVQIEFNEMNVISRTFFRDIIDALPGYDFYRLLPDGLLPLGAYKILDFEIFAFQNIVAIKR
ncbi:FkbM family methyltransferase [Chitinophaga oryziterrae]|uniref:FkbM family methyltransferase n=1 Tax=Chitinophaga oryziterrae TaxID=1031224 RepID=A0A6N8J523_9BACT|nr:FkbM family methyltransferase [Chitinophaga oryziterrae]MVT39781.1 FkbM family methyltransferase [Chitinophaga oryziterrae]